LIDSRRICLWLAGPLLYVLSLAPAHATDSPYKVHYALYQHQLTQDVPAVVEQQRLRWIVSEIPKQADNFIGFTDSKGNILQFLIHGPERIWVEVPVMAQKGSYGKVINRAAYQRLINTLTEPFSAYVRTMNLRFLSWAPPAPAKDQK